MRSNSKTIRVMGVMAMRGFRYFLLISAIFSNLLARKSLIQIRLKLMRFTIIFIRSLAHLLEQLGE